MKYPSVIIALLALGCGDDAAPPADATSPGTWQLIAEDLPSSLLAAWSSGNQNIWVVGGREAAGAGPLVYHFDGTAWTKRDTGLVNVDLWSVFGFEDAVYMGGSNGTLLRYKDGAFEQLAAPATDTVFGLWGSSSSDVWAVGGQFTGRAFVWRYQGTAFEAVPGVPADLETMGTVWKVTGRGPTDVYMSAARGLVLHWDGAAITSEAVGPTGESLFSIGCRAAGCITVGTNFSNGVLYQNDNNAGWMNRTPTEDGPVWRGMTPTAEQPYVVGMVGAVIRLDGDRWVPESHGLTQEALHAAWGDADGNVVAVGGKFDRVPTTDGVLLVKSADTLPKLP